jgi:hypothetical protein
VPLERKPAIRDDDDDDDNNNNKNVVIFMRSGKF